MLSLQHGRNIPFVSHNKCYLGPRHLARIIPHLRKEMLFGLHGRNAPLRLQEIYQFGHMREMCPYAIMEMLLNHIAGTLSSSNKINVILST